MAERGRAESAWTVRRESEWTVVVADGEIDVSNAAQLRGLLRDALASGDTAVDLSNVEFMDSSGLGALLDAYRGAREQSRRLVLVPSPAVRRLLNLTATADAFRIADTLADATADLASGAPPA